MQTIFIGKDDDGSCFATFRNPSGKNDRGVWRGCEQVACPHVELAAPGECREFRLVLVEEADDKDARIAELERQLAAADSELNAAVEHHAHWTKKIVSALPEYARYSGDLLHNVLCAIEEIKRQLAERSPGVMPEVVANVIKDLRKCIEDRSYSPACLFCFCDELEACYSPPDRYEWQPVDAASPITAEDVGRKVSLRVGGEPFVLNHFDRYGCGPGWNHIGERIPKQKSPADITHILRPVAPPFEFTGEPGIYLTDNFGECDVVRTVSGEVRIMNADFGWDEVSSDGTFPGGRIVGRVAQ